MVVEEEVTKAAEEEAGAVDPVCAIPFRRASALEAPVADFPTRVEEAEVNSLTHCALYKGSIILLYCP